MGWLRRHGSVVAVITAIALFAVGLQAVQSNSVGTIRDFQLAGCERGKLDRLVDINVYRAMANYYDGVTKAASVKSDVKLMAATVRDKLLHGAEGKMSRILVCKQAVDNNVIELDHDFLRLHGLE